MILEHSISWRKAGYSVLWRIRNSWVSCVFIAFVNQHSFETGNRDLSSLGTCSHLIP